MFGAFIYRILSRLKYRVFMNMPWGLLYSYFIITKVEETITKRERSKEI